MALLSLHNAIVKYGIQVLLDNVELHIEKNERVCLVGRNGSGKTTLMRIIRGETELDQGTVSRAQGLKVAGLPQEVPQDIQGSVYDIVISGLEKWKELLHDYHSVCAELETNQSDALLNKLHLFQQALDAEGGWQLQQEVDKVISHMGLSADAEFSTLSAGMKRRVLLARALVSHPDILLLDEPTNHLDIDSIDWLENFLSKYDGTIFFITHDRLFSEKLATRILDLDRGHLTSWACSYFEYVERKAAFLEAEEKEHKRFDKKLAEEEVWIRQGIKARRTRNEGRVRALKKMRDERQGRRERVQTVRMEIENAEKSGAMVVKAHNISFGYDGVKKIVENFSTMIMRGDRIGIVGPNGVGKSTLINILLGKNEPQQGKVKLGTNIEIAYFDQLRMQLDDTDTLQNNVGEGREVMVINKKNRHIIGYLQDFLFTPEQIRSPIKYLSGGERNRLMLAKLFTRPSNVLILDEPTNDLDVETLELLEELLLEYEGTVLLVSHDRAFLNNVVTSIFAFDEDGVVREYAGGYDDYCQQKQSRITVRRGPCVRPEAVTSSEVKKNNPSDSRPKKLSYKEKRELEEIPLKIEALESEQAFIHATMSDPKFYQEAGDKVAELTDRLAVIERELAGLYDRWGELESG